MSLLSEFLPLTPRETLMDSPGFHGPVNIGLDEMISINDQAEMVMKIVLISSI